MQEKIQFRKNFIWNILGTGLNAFISLFFMIIVTRINGVDQAGIFTLAFSTACILYSVGIYAGRIYQVTELNNKISDKDFIVNRILTSSSMILFLIVFCIYKNYNYEKSIIFLLLTIYKALEAFGDVLHGILQKNERLDMVGKSLFMKSIIGIIVFFMINIFTNSIILSISLMIVSNICVMIFYDFRKVYKYVNFKIKINIKNVLGILKNGFFIFAISFLGMYVLNAPKYSIDSYLTENMQTIFGIIIMPATIIGLVSQFLIHPYINQIVELFKKRDLKHLNKLMLKIIFMVVIFGILSSILAYLFGTQILSAIYGVNLSDYKIGLVIIIISATLYTIGTIYSSILTTVRETFSQFIIYCMVSVFAYVLSSILTKNIGVNGAICAYFLIMFLQCISYLIYTKIKLKKIFKNKE